MSDKLAGIRLKFERTKKHVADLDAAIKAFRETNPYRVSVKRDPQTRKPIYYVSHVEGVPSDIPLIASDALAGMISSLDHAVYQLFLSAGGVRGTKDRHL